MKQEKKRILVCDDDKGVLEVMKIILENNGYEVRLLDNGKGIQKVIEKYRPAVIFLDIWMPGIDGREIVLLLKRSPDTKKIPIIIVSALNDTKEIAQKYGADDYIAKPFDMEELLEKVKRLVV